MQGFLGLQCSEFSGRTEKCSSLLLGGCHIIAPFDMECYAYVTCSVMLRMQNVL
jgi:hypothetical protein